MAGKLNLGACTPYVVGDTIQFGWTFQTKEGTPIDLRGTTAWMTVKADPEDPDVCALLQLKKELPPDDADAENGQFFLVAQASETHAIPPGNHYYDLQVVWPASPEDMVQTYVLGRIRFVMDVTRRTSDPVPPVGP